MENTTNECAEMYIQSAYDIHNGKALTTEELTQLANDERETMEEITRESGESFCHEEHHIITFEEVQNWLNNNN